MFNNSDCAICQEQNNETSVMTTCCHYFHAECMNKWIKKCENHLNVTCPMCRSTVIPRAMYERIQIPERNEKENKRLRSLSQKNNFRTVYSEKEFSILVNALDMILLEMKYQPDESDLFGQGYYIDVILKNKRKPIEIQISLGPKIDKIQQFLSDRHIRYIHK